MQTHTLRVAAVVLLAACATAASEQPIPRNASQSRQTVQAEIRAKEHPIYAARAGRSPAAPRCDRDGLQGAALVKVNRKWA